MRALLSVEGLRASYGFAEVLFGIEFKVMPGEVVALMGRNGMGKSTTIRAICRMMPVSHGQLTFAGQDISHLPSHRVARLGVGLVPEGRRCFAPLTVTENLIAAARPGMWDLGRVWALFPSLAARKHQTAATLSGGEQQMLAIGRALMINPRLLVLDEATEGLAPVVRKEIWRAIRAFKDQGQAILLVDKLLAEVVSVADRAVILERGQNVWQGPASGITRETADRFLGV